MLNRLLSYSDAVVRFILNGHYRDVEITLPIVISAERTVRHDTFELYVVHYVTRDQSFVVVLQVHSVTDSKCRIVDGTMIVTDNVPMIDTSAKVIEVPKKFEKLKIYSATCHPFNLAHHLNRMNGLHFSAPLNEQ